MSRGGADAASVKSYLSITFSRYNGGMKAAENQINDRNYTKPFLADSRRVIALAVELDDMGKGLIDWKEVKWNV